jgi:hypothetical protein
MDWLIATLLALLDDLSPRPSGAFREFADDRAEGLGQVMAENRRTMAETVDKAAAGLRDDADLIKALIEEINLLNREVAEIAARNIVLSAGQRRLEAQHESDRAHIRELIAEMVRRDIR